MYAEFLGDSDYDKPWLYIDLRGKVGIGQELAHKVQDGDSVERRTICQVGVNTFLRDDMLIGSNPVRKNKHGIERVITVILSASGVWKVMNNQTLQGSCNGRQVFVSDQSRYNQESNIFL